MLQLFFPLPTPFITLSQFLLRTLGSSWAPPLAQPQTASGQQFWDRSQSWHHYLQLWGPGTAPLPSGDSAPGSQGYTLSSISPGASSELCPRPQQGAVGRAISCTPLEVAPLGEMHWQAHSRRPLLLPDSSPPALWLSQSLKPQVYAYLCLAALPDPN